MAGDREQGPRGSDRIASGEDPSPADEWILALERAVQAARTRVEGLEVRATQLATDVGEVRQRLRDGGPLTYGELGARIEQVLRLGDEQANNLVAAASCDCAELLARAQAQAALTRANARQEAEELRLCAWQDRSKLLQDAETWAETLAVTAARTAEELLAAAEREAETLRAATETGLRQQRAATAEELAARAAERAVQVIDEADEHARYLVATTRQFADGVLAQADDLADATVAQAGAEAERHVRAVRQPVDELARQRDRIIGHLELLRRLLGLTPGPDRFAGDGGLAAVGRRRRLLLRVQASGCCVVGVRGVPPEDVEPV